MLIALHVGQELLLGGTASSLPPSTVGSGSGYGPPHQDSTPLSRIVHSTLYLPSPEPTPAESAQGFIPSVSKSDYDQVCIPLANASWQERWERMCTISSSGTMMDLGASGTMMDLGASMSSSASARANGEDLTKREAEKWRAGGGFGRGEVNITRSGQFRFREFIAV